MQYVQSPASGAVALSMKPIMVAPNAFTAETAATISAVDPVTDEMTTTLLSVMRLLPSVLYCAAFSTTTGRSLSSLI